MELQNLVIQSQLYPPRPRKSVLRRPRLERLLETELEHPLTFVQAGTGYGKSTALAFLSYGENPLFWYTISETDRDPLLFLVHLLSAFREHGREALDILEGNDGELVPAVLNSLLNTLTRKLEQGAILVLDDFHIIAGVGEIEGMIRKMVDLCPPHLHIVLSTRHMPELADVNRWLVKGTGTVIGAGELAFTVAEIDALFRDQYQSPITPQQAKALAEETEGWAIALQIIWHGIQAGLVADLDTALKRIPDTLDRLFDYLAPEVLARQPSYLQTFLVTTAVLRQLDGAACDALLQTHDSYSMLRHLYDIGLFVDLVGEDTYRYQRLFHDFLLNQAARDPDKVISLHARAADYYEQTGHPEECLHHLLAGRQYARAASLIEQIGGGMPGSGRLDSLSDWFQRLPEEFRKTRPVLEMLYGDVCRLRADFEQALIHFKAAERLFREREDVLGHCRALRGQAQVHLDTVRPLEASALLLEALDMLDPEEHRQETADLLDQLAENKLNSGFPDQGRTLHQDSLRLRGERKPTDIYLEARILLRTGKLKEARLLLEAFEQDETPPDQQRQQHFHREKQLLLSLLCALMGDREGAEQYALQGIDVGKRMQSEYVQAVGFMRLGHAWQMDSFSPWGEAKRQEAIHCYEDVIEKGRSFKAARVSLEPLWGLCRAHGYAGELDVMEEYAQQAVDISESAGDEWLGNLVRVTVGASMAMQHQARNASRWLKEAAEGMDRVKDSFGWSTAQLWLALNAWWQGETETALRHLSALLPVVGENGYEYLLTQRTHQGLKDDQNIMPLLVAANEKNIEREQVTGLLQRVGKCDLSYHPGYTVWVRTLGPLRVWRGEEEVSAKEWQREKARRLFQLLVATRGQWQTREQITDLLWRDLPEENAVRDFKAALNSLQRVLEPRRPSNTPPFFIIRRGNTYGINPQAEVRLDSEEFLRGAASERVEDLQAALAIYEDEYLPECLYEDWASTGREFHHQKYVEAAVRMAKLQLQAREYETALATCQEALQKDKCCEPAFKLMMEAHAAHGNLPQALAAYQRCEKVLREELGVEPSKEIKRLHDLLTKGF